MLLTQLTASLRPHTARSRSTRRRSYPLHQVALYADEKRF